MSSSAPTLVHAAVLPHIGGYISIGPPSLLRGATGDVCVKAGSWPPLPLLASSTILTCDHVQTHDTVVAGVRGGWGRCCEHGTRLWDIEAESVDGDLALCAGFKEQSASVGTREGVLKEGAESWLGSTHALRRAVATLEGRGRTSA